MLVSEDQELAMRAESDPAVIAQMALYPSNKIQAFINERSKQMGAISHRPKLTYQFRVVNTPVILISTLIACA